jgi:hypothetical protein
MNDQGKSDRLEIPTKPPNKADERAAEAVEGRSLAKRNADQQNTLRTQSRAGVPSALDRVREVARRDKKAKFTALYHHLTIERLRGAFHALKRRAAPGIDGVTWEQYAANLEDNLKDLHERLRRGAYRPKPSRRVSIPKADGRLRPLGIASLEDKVVQLAVGEVLNAIYETDFLGFSYGFRPGRSQHQALDALAVGIRRGKVNWMLDADIRGFFRRHRPQMDGEVCRAPNSRQTDSATHPEMAESRSDGGGEEHRVRGRDATRGNDHSPHTIDKLRWRSGVSRADLRQRTPDRRKR